MPWYSSQHSTRGVPAAVLLALLATTPGLRAAVTDIANEPVLSVLTQSAKPNLMFILDDSGSMDWSFMPDAMGDDDRNPRGDTYGYWSSQCNGLAFDPSAEYPPPVTSTGASYPNMAYTAALNDGYLTSSRTISLRGSYFYRYTGSEPKLSWQYNTSGLADRNTLFSRQCLSRIGDRPGSAVFTRVNLDDPSLGDAGVALRQKYANWFSYYARRYLLMRTAVGRAVQSLDSRYRLGFSRINNTSIVDGPNFRDVKPFDADQKANFYGSLYGAAPGGGTPLRGALSKVGRYYAKKVPGQTYDPIEHSCQRNYAILSTDGYWNSGGAPGVAESASYGPINLAGGAVGNQDGREPRPMFDASGSSNTLSDVAQYYYAVDLRTPALGNCASRDVDGKLTDVCENTVPVAGRDLNNAQHLTTFAIGLGVSGTLAYDKDYLRTGGGDFNALIAGTKNWPATTTEITGVSGDARNIDDLWHAAVNGRGQYYSALTGAALSDAIKDITNSVNSRPAAGSAVSFNSVALNADGTSRLYQADYTPGLWVGDVQSFLIDATTGALGTRQWSAQQRLGTTAWSSRKIFFRKPGGSSGLAAFEFANLGGDLARYFSNLCGQPVVATQCSSPAFNSGASGPRNRELANSGENLVNYLRGDPIYEANNSASPLFRSRVAPALDGAQGTMRGLLGDIVGGAPTFVGAPPLVYTDAGYAAFAARRASRPAVVYAPANDGMLHAFDALTGNELWAYVPTAVMPQMYKLANTSYADEHQFMVDGEPVVGDIFANGEWKTILVGGLGAGGRAYYALDITDPLAPKSLWEFTDVNLGLSFGNPIITKRADGTWIVAFASGYNNTAGDGLGRLFVLDANTGVPLLSIATTAGTPASPSGLAKINAWVDKATNNTATRIYGGDLQGNLWRFDIDNLVQPNQAAHLLARLQAPGGDPQPITVKPEPVLISGTYPAVAIATGRFLGSTDLGDSAQQSVYLLKDSLTATGLGVVRNKDTVVKHTLTVTGLNADTSTETVDWATQDGWWFDLPNSGERVITNFALRGNRLTVASLVPNSDPCKAGGASWKYDINLVTGLKTSGVFGRLFSAKAFIVGVSNVSGVNDFQLIRLSDGSTPSEGEPPGSAPVPSVTRRSSWRELVD